MLKAYDACLPPRSGRATIIIFESQTEIIRNDDSKRPRALTVAIPGLPKHNLQLSDKTACRRVNLYRPQYFRAAPQRAIIQSSSAASIKPIGKASDRPENRLNSLSPLRTQAINILCDFCRIRSGCLTTERAVNKR